MTCLSSDILNSSVLQPPDAIFVFREDSKKIQRRFFFIFSCGTKQNPGKRSWQTIPASDSGKRSQQALDFFKFLNLLPKVYYMLQVYLVNTPPCGITKSLHSSIISIMTRTRNKVLLQRESRKQLDHQQQFPVDELGWQINRARLLNEREKDGGFKRWIKVVSNSGYFPHSDKCNAALHLWICY